MLNDKTEEILLILRGISARLDYIEARLPGSVGAAGSSQPYDPLMGPPSGTIATDEDLASKYGDPIVFKDPPKWPGDSYKDMPFSKCPPEYLNQIAGFADWKAKKDDEAGATDKHGNPKSKWARIEASRARAWSKRNATKVGRPAAAPRPAPPKSAHQEEVPWDENDEPPF
jgi:hypothetical protein